MQRLLWILVVMLAGSAFAQDKKGGGAGGNVSYKKQTEYSFEDDTIEGDLTKPDGEYVEARKNGEALEPHQDSRRVQGQGHAVGGRAVAARNSSRMRGVSLFSSNVVAGGSSWPSLSH